MIIEIKLQDKKGFTVSDEDLIWNCNQCITDMATQIEEARINPDKLDENGLLPLKGFDELLESYYTYKFIIREYDLETPKEMEKIEKFIADLIRISK
nr:MAG TPA: hypothetical protein [Caudoviricetes sp.]